MDLSRKEFLTATATVLAAALTPGFASAQQTPATSPKLTVDDLKSAAKLAGLELTDAQLKELLPGVQENVDTFPELRKLTDDSFLAPSTTFRVMGSPKEKSVRVTPRAHTVKRPATDADLAFLSAAELSHLVHTKQVTSLELTKMYLSRLKTYGPKLRCVVNLTKELALKQAAEADKELAAGKSRGPLHGLPYGLKDLFAVPGYPTTWGAAPYRDQRFEQASAVFERLTKAGAVCVAKLSMGALAQGDVWFVGRTESPWDPKIGSSGSSAGSGSATAAGLVAFAVGTETSGSVVSPSHNCRVTGLRPTFGSISRYGAMALSWTMDKVGPICRTAEDCALVFAALIGEDPRDPSTTHRGFRYRPGVELGKLRVGVFAEEKDMKAPLKPVGKPHLEVLQKLGAKLTPATLPAGPDGLGIILVTESAAAFDALTHSGHLDDLGNSAWPKTFRECHFIPAVEMVQADRARRRLQEQYEEFWQHWDVLVFENQGYARVYQWNLTGHPQVLVPMGADSTGRPYSLSLVGPLFSEARLLAIADAVQRETGQTLRRPEMSRWA
jgi:Asp-tRNA(Asn)/Glu-tRNA(Gln) amidotransferase A subunit family amidase